MIRIHVKKYTKAPYQSSFTLKQTTPFKSVHSSNISNWLYSWVRFLELSSEIVTKRTLLVYKGRSFKCELLFKSVFTYICDHLMNLKSIFI